MTKLEGKVAVITGAASGIGRALATELAACGCKLALVDVNRQRLDQVAAELSDSAAATSVHVADVRDETRMSALPAEVIGELGGVDVLINNAGVTAWGTVEELSLEDFHWVIDVNLWGAIHGCKFFLPHLRKAEEAHIVNVSSLFGILAARRQAAYCASKFAIRGLTESLDAELVGSNVKVTCVHPGGVATNFIADSRTVDETAKSEFQKLVAERSTPPEKVARAIVAAIKSEKLRVRVGPDAFVGDWMKRLMPVRGQRMLANFLAKVMP